MVLQQREFAAGNRTEYALAGDFCRIFAEDMDGLYTLGLLLTADPGKAERCFALALEDCLGATRIFKEWAGSWARRAVIRRAVQTVRPAPESHSAWEPAYETARSALTQIEVPLSAILRLKTFERFVFVMSVLDRCSDQDGTILLACSRSAYVRARSRALARVASFMEEKEAPPVAGAATFLSYSLAAKAA